MYWPVRGFRNKKNAFTILELLVVLAVIGVFSVVAYPKISNWIEDRNVKKEVYETVTFIKERKSEVTSGKYGMVQVLLNRQLQVFTMSPERFSQIYKGFNSPYASHKQNYTCGFGDTAGLPDKINMIKKILECMCLIVMSIFIQAHGTTQAELQFVSQKMVQFLIIGLIKMAELKMRQQVKWLIFLCFAQNQTLPKVHANIDSNL